MLLNDYYGDVFMNVHIKNLLPVYVEELKKLFGRYLESVYLFGSHARGCATEDSDIDILIVVNSNLAVSESFQSRLLDCSYSISLENDVLFMPIVFFSGFYYKHLHTHPLLINVNQEGVCLYINAVQTTVGHTESNAWGERVSRRG